MTAAKGQVAIVVLAAGASRRLGFPKQLCRWQGQTLLERTVDVALKTQLGPVFVVLGAHQAACQEVLSRYGCDLGLIVNPNYQDGLSSSIKAAASALAEKLVDWRGLIFCVCDQLYLNPHTLEELLKASGEGELDHMVAASYGGTWGTPFYLPRRFLPWLSALEGDKGIKSLARSHDLHPILVEFLGGEQDLDSPEDLAALNVLPPQANW